MTLHEVMAELESLGDAKTRKLDARAGCGENQFGVKMGDLRAIAKRIKSDHDLALALWQTGNLDARILASFLLVPKRLTAEDLDAMVREVRAVQLADTFTTQVVKLHPQKEELRLRWMSDPDPGAARAGWSLTTERVIKDPSGLDLGALLDRIEAEMAGEPEFSKWTMNFCLGEIGINHPAFRDRALAIGEKVGAYRDYPVSKGCIPPYVPVWVHEMVSRQG